MKGEPIPKMILSLGLSVTGSSEVSYTPLIKHCETDAAQDGLSTVLPPSVMKVACYG